MSAPVTPRGTGESVVSDASTAGETCLPGAGSAIPQNARFPVSSLQTPYVGRRMAATSGLDVLVIAFRGLSGDEQEETLERLEEEVLRRRSAGESDTAALIGSLVRVRDELGRTPSVDDYKRIRAELVTADVEIAPLSQLIRHFGSWRQAKEALTLSGNRSPRQIEARFRARRLGKIWRYRDETLAETLRRCRDDIGHVPQVAEFSFWRERQLELARAKGDDALHLPSASPYRKRWGSWQGALRHLGYSTDEIAERLEAAPTKPLAAECGRRPRKGTATGRLTEADSAADKPPEPRLPDHLLSAVKREDRSDLGEVIAALASTDDDRRAVLEQGLRQLYYVGLVAQGKNPADEPPEHCRAFIKHCHQAATRLRSE